MTEPFREIVSEDLSRQIPWDTYWAQDISSPLYASGEWGVQPLVPVLDVGGDPVLDDPPNRGGLQALAPLATAVLVCLFTDKRRPDDVDAPSGTNERRGWHGDTFDIDGASGERELGSLLWTLERAILSEETARLAKQYAEDALQTLVDQGAVSRVEIAAAVNRQEQALILHVAAMNEEGESIFKNTFPIG